MDLKEKRLHYTDPSLYLRQNNTEYIDRYMCAIKFLEIHFPLRISICIQKSTSRIASFSSKIKMFLVHANNRFFPHLKLNIKSKNLV